MILAQAQRWSSAILTQLKPLCYRIEIAGSIRRCRPECADIDIVCIPKIRSIKDLLGAETNRTNLVLEWARSYVSQLLPAVHGPGEQQPCIISGGEREGKQLIVQLRRCQLDLWFASDETFATRLICRTGSKEHNIWLADRAKALNGHWNPYEGVNINGIFIPSPTEECLYAALDLPFIPPENRELAWIQKNIPPLTCFPAPSRS